MVWAPSLCCVCVCVYLFQCSSRSCACVLWRAPDQWWRRWWWQREPAERCGAEEPSPSWWSLTQSADLSHTHKALHMYNNTGGTHTLIRRANSLGTPETSLRGLRTLKALKALTSRPPGFPGTWWVVACSPDLWVIVSKMTLNNLHKQRQEKKKERGNDD